MPTPRLRSDDLTPPRPSPCLPVPRVESAAAFGLQVSNQVTQCRRYGERFSVLWMEAEALAAEGQVWPPEAREQLMQALSARLRNRVRATDQVMQVGEHGFAVLLLAAGAAEAAIVEQRLRQLLTGPYGVDCGLMHAELRLGHAAYPDDGRNGAELAHKARQQMRPQRPA